MRQSLSNVALVESTQAQTTEERGICINHTGGGWLVARSPFLLLCSFS